MYIVPTVQMQLFFSGEEKILQGIYICICLLDPLLHIHTQIRGKNYFLIKSKGSDLGGSRSNFEGHEILFLMKANAKGTDFQQAM